MLQTIVRAPRTAEDIAQGARLAKIEKRDIGPAEVARVLNAAKLNFVIVGAHAANGYLGRPRNTVDVDVIVENPKKASVAIARAFKDLSMRDTPVVVRFTRPDGEEAIDLMKPLGSRLWKQLLKIAVTIEIDGVRIRIPPLEGVLAAKLAAMTSPARRLLDKQQDGLDFARMVSVNETINLAKLESLGELVYPGGGKEILKHVADVRAGKRPEF
jgi:predicted nucleotidyltransferase